MLLAAVTVALISSPSVADDLSRFKGQWRREEHSDCKASVRTNLSILPKMMIYEFGNIGIVLCDVTGVRKTKDGYSYVCRYTFAHGGHDAEPALLKPLGPGKIELISKGGVRGVFEKCPATKRY